MALIVTHLNAEVIQVVSVGSDRYIISLSPHLGVKQIQPTNQPNYSLDNLNFTIHTMVLTEVTQQPVESGQFMIIIIQFYWAGSDSVTSTTDHNSVTERLMIINFIYNAPVPVLKHELQTQYSITSVS